MPLFVNVLLVERGFSPLSINTIVLSILQEERHLEVILSKISPFWEITIGGKYDKNALFLINGNQLQYTCIENVMSMLIKELIVYVIYIVMRILQNPRPLEFSSYQISNN